MLLCVTKTWLNDDISSSLLTDGVKYNVPHKNRLDKKKGGPAWQIKSIINVLHITLPDIYSCVEIVVVDIIYNKTKHRLASVYGAPDSNEYYMMLLCACIKYICSVTYPCAITSDLNFDFFYPHQNNVSSEFYNSIYDSDLYQIVNEPTRNDGLLDLILCYSRMYVRKVCVGD